MRRFIFMVLGLMVLFTFNVSTDAQTEPHDVLIYQLIDHGGDSNMLMMWDPQTHEHTLLLSDSGDGVSSGYFVLHESGLIAYRAGREGNWDIYVIDIHSDSIEPINITRTPSLSEGIVEWSPDGRSLAFTGYVDRSLNLYIWNGETIQNITPLNTFLRPTYYFDAWSEDGAYLTFTAYYTAQSSRLFVWDGETYLDITPDNLRGNARGYNTYWSPDGRLAFTVWYRFSDYMETGESEVYLWDGQSTTKIENPTDYDEFTVLGWSNSGQLALQASKNPEGDIFVWDGVSMDNSSAPDVNSFTQIAPDLTEAFTDAFWISDGRLTFSAVSEGESRLQIYIWDGETIENISQKPDYNNGGQTWSNDGRWAFQTELSPETLVYVRDVNNENILVEEGGYPIWSSEGILAFCRNGDLFIWDGQQTLAIQSGRTQARWLIGSSSRYGTWYSAHCEAW